MKLRLSTVFLLIAIILIYSESFACTISLSTANFGNYESNQAFPLYGQGSVTVECDSGVSYNIGLDNGLNPVSLYRRMNYIGDYLSYQLYRDSNCVTIWGNTAGIDTQPGTGTGVTQIYTIYGKIPEGQTIPDGNYADTIRVTVYY
jgi:spore coat protein U-like protein